MRDFVESISSSSTTPEIPSVDDVALDKMNKDQLCSEVQKLRNQLAELSEEREADRKSILILQGQIDTIRDSSKCSDSFETTLNLIGRAISCAWNKMPSIQFPSLHHSTKKKRYFSESSKPTGRTSKKAASTRSTPPPSSVPAISNFIIHSNPVINKP